MRVCVRARATKEKQNSPLRSVARTNRNRGREKTEGFFYYYYYFLVLINRRETRPPIMIIIIIIIVTTHPRLRVVRIGFVVRCLLYCVRVQTHRRTRVFFREHRQAVVQTFQRPLDNDAAAVSFFVSRYCHYGVPFKTNGNA